MLAEGKNKIVSSLIVAKMDWLLSRPAKAISILEDLIQKHGEESDGQSYKMPVAITANYWIGTIARQNNDGLRAKKAYENVLACAARHPEDHAIGHEAEKQYCYQYIAEVEAGLLNQKEAALTTLMKIPKKLSRFEPGSEKAKLFKLLYPGEEMDWDADQAWIEHQVAILNGKPDEARKNLEGSLDTTGQKIGSMAAAAFRSGIPLRPWINGYGEENRVLLIQGLRLAIKSKSPIDRSFALLALGSELQSDHPVEAEKYYTELLESDLFMAPEGGVYLVALQKNQGKIEEANQTCERIKKRFPQYASYFKALSKIIYVDQSPNRPPEVRHFNL